LIKKQSRENKQMNRPDRVNRRTAIIYWCITLGYMGIVFLFSSISGDLLQFSLNGYGRILHTVIYAVLAFLVYISLNKSGMMRHVLLLSFLVASLYGITDEIHQYYVPGRVASIGDIAADCIGAFLGSCSAAIVVVKQN
jgi:Ni,Fe-hydrogenase I cytochrome b subunit